MTSATTDQPRRLLYVANEDFAFLLNRLPMARAARAGLRSGWRAAQGQSSKGERSGGFRSASDPLPARRIVPVRGDSHDLGTSADREQDQAADRASFRSAMLRLRVDRRPRQDVLAGQRHHRPRLYLHVGILADAAVETEHDMASALAPESAAQSGSRTEP